MKDGEFGCAGDISQGNTLARWSTPRASTFDNDPLALLHRSRSGFPGSIDQDERDRSGLGPAFVSICNI